MKKEKPKNQRIEFITKRFMNGRLKLSGTKGFVPAVSGALKTA